jgi:hypothetical protein
MWPNFAAGQFCRFATDLFGHIPDSMKPCFDKVKYKSSATQGRDAVDVVRFMKMLYMMTCPDGEFHPDRSRTPTTGHALLSSATPPVAPALVKACPRCTSARARKELRHEIRRPPDEINRLRLPRTGVQVQCTKKESGTDHHLDIKTQIRKTPSALSNSGTVQI